MIKKEMRGMEKKEEERRNYSKGKVRNSKRISRK